MRRGAAGPDLQQIVVAAELIDHVQREIQIVVDRLRDLLPEEVHLAHAEGVIQHVRIADQHDEAGLDRFLQSGFLFRSIGFLRILTRRFDLFRVLGIFRGVRLFLLLDGFCGVAGFPFGEGGREGPGQLDGERVLFTVGLEVAQDHLPGLLCRKGIGKAGIVGGVQQRGLLNPFDRFAGEASDAEEQQIVERGDRRIGGVHLIPGEGEDGRHRFDRAVAAAHPGAELAVGDQFVGGEFDSPARQELAERGAGRLHVRLVHPGEREGIEEGQQPPAAQHELIERVERRIAELAGMNRQHHIDVGGNLIGGGGNLHHIEVPLEFGDDPPRRLRRLTLLHHHDLRRVVAAHDRQCAQNSELYLFRRGHFSDGAGEVIFKLCFVFRVEEREHSRLAAGTHRDAEVDWFAGAECVERLAGDAVEHGGILLIRIGGGIEFP